VFKWQKFRQKAIKNGQYYRFSGKNIRLPNSWPGLIPTASGIKVSGDGSYFYRVGLQPNSQHLPPMRGGSE
jgi:hypothetical protein